MSKTLIILVIVILSFFALTIMYALCKASSISDEASTRYSVNITNKKKNESKKNDKEKHDS